MINLSDVATGLLGLGVIAAAVGLVAVGGRDRTADEHDLSDYVPPPMPRKNGRAVTVRVSRPVHRRVPSLSIDWDDVLPPAPDGADAGSPLYVETLFRTWHPDAPDVVAGRMLREIAAEQSDDVIWNRDTARDLCGSCDAGLPMSCTCRDLTGAFPVVAVA